MKQIKVLGSGCTKCVKTAEAIQTVIDELQADANVSKDTSPEAILHYGVMKTPAVVIDGTLVHSGSIPLHDTIESWLKK
jgi:small redox-active disulfide protein 2